VHEKLSSRVLEASSRHPSSAVLIAEVVLFLGEQVAGAVLQRLSPKPTATRIEGGHEYDNEGVLTLTFLTRARTLQRHVGQTVIAAIGQLAAVANSQTEQTEKRDVIVWKPLRLLIPLLVYLLPSKEHRVELAALLLKLLSLPGSYSGDLEDALVVLALVVHSGQAPPWHSYCVHQRNNVQALPATNPELDGMRPAILKRLLAGLGGVPSSVVFNVAPDAAETETDPWSLVGGGSGGGGLHGEKTAAHFLLGTSRLARSQSLFY
jgi:hypothetical protein